MPETGLFIPLFDEETLHLYLNGGLYGEHRAPEFGAIDSHSKHFAALADAACARQGTHVFFFHERTIIYGGQIIGAPNHGSFYINGPYSPLGRAVGADIYWDESDRRIYRPTERSGIFQVKRNGYVERCQPYLIRFEDELDLKGQAIESDVLYSELSLLPYPVASNSIQEMSFCTITPGETRILLDLLGRSPLNIGEEPRDDINIVGDPILFEPELGIQHLKDSVMKFHHDASIFANPNLLPPEIRPRGAAICRRVAITPFKPSGMDKADIGYYSDDEIRDGTLPNTVIELEWKRAGGHKLHKFVRYMKWLNLLSERGLIEPDDIDRMSFYLCAPSFRGNVWDGIPAEYRARIRLISWI